MHRPAKDRPCMPYAAFSKTIYFSGCGGSLNLNCKYMHKKSACSCNVYECRILMYLYYSLVTYVQCFAFCDRGILAI